MKMDGEAPLTICGRPWCREERLTRVSFGDGKAYWRCRLGHVTPTPPPPDLYAIDELADADDFDGGVS